MISFNLMGTIKAYGIRTFVEKSNKSMKFFLIPEVDISDLSDIFV